MKASTYETRFGDIDKKLLYQTYTNYIDPSTIISNHYQKKQFYPGQDKYVLKINNWVQEKLTNNQPLVFKTEPGIGIKSLLVNWQKQMQVLNKTKKEKSLVIMHFASSGSNNSNYFYSIYRIIIKLRQAFKLKQNVDLLEQKIRNYFAYWLDLCNSEIQKQMVIYCAQEIYDKVIIVIEGVDKFFDNETGKEANIAFWLPQKFPKNVRVIVTASQGSAAIEHFQRTNCQIITLEQSNEITEYLLAKALKKNTMLNVERQKVLHQKLKQIVKKNEKFSGIYNLIQLYDQCILIEKNHKNKETNNILKQLIEQKMNIYDLDTIDSLENFYKVLLGLWTQHLPFKAKIEQIIKFLVITQKGLTAKQLISLSGITQKEWACFQIAAGGLLINYNGQYSIKSMSFLRFYKDKANSIQMHEKIATVLQNTQNSIRKLEQQTYHLFVAKSYFKLKETISNIQNFLLLFNPNNKYQLSRYWQRLEEKGFDPVIQYNKAIQGFSMHYHPSDENMFRIIVQISRFLKEFCDFQTYQTPSFRHPYIQGSMVQMQKIGLLKQLSDLGIYVDNSFGQQPQIDDSSLQQQIKKLKQKHFPKDQSEQTICLQALAATISSKSKTRRKDPVPILSDIEQLNVDVPMNREKFRQYYLQSLQQYMKKEEGYGPNSKQSKYLQNDVDVNAQEILPSPPQNVVQCFNKIRENYRLRPIKPTLYYYKRWIWIQFPWVCLSLYNNYSTTPQLCHKPETDDSDALQLEAKYTKQALIVAIGAKQRKKQMFSPKYDSTQERGSRFKNTFSNTLSKKSKQQSQIGFRSQLKTNNSFDLSLSALTKELQLRKKFQDDGQKAFVTEPISCEQQMKFITQRKKFQEPNLNGVPTNQILPKLKWLIKQHTHYELSYFKSHIEEKKKKLNKIIYENKKLAEIYKELKLKETLNKKNVGEHEGEKNGKKSKVLQELLKKKEEVITNFCKSLLQKERLKIILKLCSQNKTRNEQYLASLNYLLQNIKKMISWERQKLKQTSEKLDQMKITQQKKQEITREKDKNQEILKQKIQDYLQEKDKLQQQIEGITNIITDDIKDQKDRLQSCLSGHLKNRQQKTIALMQEKKKKQLEEKLQKIEKDYRSLQELFQFQGVDFQNAPKFKKLLEENQKNKKLKIAYFQRKHKLEIVMKQHQKLKEQAQKQNAIPQAKATKKQQVKVQKKHLSSYEIKLQILLDNLSLKLGVSSHLQILPTLKNKLEQLKQTWPQKYQAIINPSLQPYCQQYQSFE